MFCWADFECCCVLTGLNSRWLTYRETRSAVSVTRGGIPRNDDRVTVSRAEVHPNRYLRERGMALSAPAILMERELLPILGLVPMVSKMPAVLPRGSRLSGGV